mmetsp:Transcript_73200/g.191890  ORF Transcript_73200/g.191890 Transcript_73200/m.191890 type:complete len:362 (+) Transcript_73200:58-1143(+)
MVVPAAEPELCLPAVDLSAPESQIVREIHEQLTTIGFLHLKNIPSFPNPEHPEELLAFDDSELLMALQVFHASMTAADKRSVMWRNHNPENTNIFRGLAPFVDDDESHKELFDMGLPYRLVSEAERKVAPLQEETPFPRCPHDLAFVELRRYFEGQYQHRLLLGLKLVEYIALGLGLERDFFRSWFERDSLSTWRTIWTLPRARSTVRSASLSAESLQLTTPAHSDSGFLTILSTLGFPGLQVLVHDGEGDQTSGSWRALRPEKGQLVVNLGDMFERTTGGLLKATRHRVLDIGVERWSQPFFLDPKYSQRIPERVVGRGAGAAEGAGSEEEGELVFGDWLIGKMKSSYKEWANLEVPGKN